jgi:DNA polymerase-3 subunit epsilon
MNFTAIDFETATGARDSACSLGIVTVRGGVIVDRYHTLIRPPGNVYNWHNTQVHGITPQQTENTASFASLFPEIEQRLGGYSLVAHNAPFDRAVLVSCLQAAGLDHTDYAQRDHWECTLKLYRKKGYKPCRLSDCCSTLDIPLKHHDALSVAVACAELYLRA